MTKLSSWTKSLEMREIFEFCKEICEISQDMITLLWDYNFVKYKIITWFIGPY